MTSPILLNARSVFSGAIAALLLSALPATAQNLLVNGSFENTGSFVAINPSADWSEIYGYYQNAGFASDELGRQPVNGTLYPEGRYVIAGANGAPISPSAYNHNFRAMTGDYDGTGAMMIVNGSTELDHGLWISESIVGGAGGGFRLSARITNVNLLSSWGGNETAWRNAMPILHYEYELDGSGVWTEFGTELDLTSASNPEAWHLMEHEFDIAAGHTFRVRLANRQTVPYGNDFALDAMSLIALDAVPEPSSLALLLPGVALMLWRKRRASAA